MPTFKLNILPALSAAVLFSAALVGCGDVPVDASEALDDGAAKVEAELDLALCASDEHTFSLHIDNHYFPLPVGRVWYYEGEEDGVPITLEVSVLDSTEVVDGVTTRVVRELETEDGELIEISHNFYAQSEQGTVCYFGEDVDIYEDGVVVSNEGAWRAGEGASEPGIYMPKNPRVGMIMKQENAPGIAEDEAEVTGRNELVEVPYGSFRQTILTEDCALDGDCGEKAYGRGMNLLIDGDLELVSVQ